MYTLKTLGAAVLLCIAGCTVGPDFVPQTNGAPSTWWDQRGEVPTSVTYGSEVDAHWWTRLGDPVLTSLIGRLAAENLDLQQATERVLQGRAQRQVVAAEGLPHLDANLSYDRVRASPTGLLALYTPAPGAPLEINLYEQGLSSSWELDLFGRVRRAVEAAQANTQALNETRHGVALMAVADLAQDYIELRGTQRLEEITRDNLGNVQKNVELVHDRYTNGVGTTLDIANAEAQRSTISAILPQLAAQEARLINAIGLLLAQPPRALEPELSAHTSTLSPPVIPVGLPGDLARRRPDIREAEARLHAATARTGVAVASFYPDIRLTGTAGTQALQFGQFYNGHSVTFGVGPAIDLPIFEGGQLRGTLHLRESEQRQAAIGYRETVLKAWQETDDAMTAYDLARKRRADVSDAVARNTDALAAARQRYSEGAADFLNVIAAEDALLDGSRALTDADTGIAKAFIAVYRTLGGGWDTIAP
jgi:NodT family efflux transporter outer membrane factor (OMF) lipoprotein